MCPRTFPASHPMQAWQINPSECLDLISHAFLALHGSLPCTAFSSQNSPRLFPEGKQKSFPAALPSLTQLHQSQILAAAIAATAKSAVSLGATAGREGTTLTLLEASAVALSEQLSLSSRASSDPAIEARLSASGATAMAALLHLLSMGQVHPETPGLVDRLLPTLPNCLTGLDLSSIGGDDNPSTAKGQIPAELLLVDELCRSKRVAGRIIRNTGVSQVGNTGGGHCRWAIQVGNTGGPASGGANASMCDRLTSHSLDLKQQLS